MIVKMDSCSLRLASGLIMTTEGNLCNAIPPKHVSLEA